MATAVYTDSMKAQAQALLSRSHHWARGKRNSDDLEVVLFLSSQTTPDGLPIHYMTRLDGKGCTCRSWLFRSACSHALACQMVSERQARAEADSKPRKSYNQLFGVCEARGCDEDRAKGEDFCEKHVLCEAF